MRFELPRFPEAGPAEVMELRWLVLALAAGCVFPAVQAFYLPGVAPVTFGFCQNVEVKVNKLTSVHTQLPLDYYSMPFCT